MALKRFSCRTHGGIFTKQAARGRQPVRCTEDYPCDKADGTAPEYKVGDSVTVGGSKFTKHSEYPTVLAESNAEARSGPNPSLPMAKAAKEQLVALGWTVEGRAYEHMASIKASRGAETLQMLWSDGKIVGQDYSLEYETAAENGLPGRKLSFNPDEMTDRELVERIRGMKVTWWNTLASSDESGIVGNKVSITHMFDGTAEPKRVVNFTDHGGRGFRSFYVNALMKVG